MMIVEMQALFILLFIALLPSSSFGFEDSMESLHKDLVEVGDDTWASVKKMDVGPWMEWLGRYLKESLDYIGGMMSQVGGPKKDPSSPPTTKKPPPPATTKLPTTPPTTTAPPPTKETKTTSASALHASSLAVSELQQKIANLRNSIKSKQQ